MLDGPKRPAGVSGILLNEIRWVRVKSFAQIRLRHARGEVTAYAQDRITCRSRADPERLLQVRHFDRSGACVDRAITQLLDDREHRRRMMIVGTDVVDARSDEDD